jgi:hypothetical protein
MFMLTSLRRLRVAQLFTMLVLGGLAAAPAGLKAQPVLVYDTLTGATLTATGSTPRTFMGNAINLAVPSGWADLEITNLTVYLYSAAAANYTDIQVNVQFWNTASLANSGSTPAFSSAAGSLLTWDEGANNLVAGVYYSINVTLATPLLLTGSGPYGITISYQGDTGSGLAPNTNLTSLLRTTSAFTTGSPALIGYYRNAAGETNYNFIGSDAKTLATNSSIALKIYAEPVPEPGTFALMGGLLTVGAVLALRRKR